MCARVWVVQVCTCVCVYYITPFTKKKGEKSFEDENVDITSYWTNGSLWRVGKYPRFAHISMFLFPTVVRISSHSYNHRDYLIIIYRTIASSGVLLYKRSVEKDRFITQRELSDFLVDNWGSARQHFRWRNSFSLSELVCFSREWRALCMCICICACICLSLLSIFPHMSSSISSFLFRLLAYVRNYALN